MTITAYVPAATWHPTMPVFDDAEASALLICTGLEVAADNCRYINDKTGAEVLYKPDYPTPVAVSTVTDTWVDFEMFSAPCVAGGTLKVSAGFTLDMATDSTAYFVFGRIAYSIDGGTKYTVGAAECEVYRTAYHSVKVSLFGITDLALAGTLRLFVGTKNTTTGPHVGSQVLGSAINVSATVYPV